MLGYIYTICDLGGYGVYIWPCYILLLTLLAWQILSAIKRNAEMHKRVQIEWNKKREKQT